LALPLAYLFQAGARLPQSVVHVCDLELLIDFAGHFCSKWNMRNPEKRWLAV
jgi:hypothetical protein